MVERRNTYWGHLQTFKLFFHSVISITISCDQRNHRAGRAGSQLQMKYEHIHKCSYMIFLSIKKTDLFIGLCLWYLSLAPVQRNKRTTIIHGHTNTHEYFWRKGEYDRLSEEDNSIFQFDLKTMHFHDTFGIDIW